MNLFSFILVSLFGYVIPYKILMMCPAPSYSHHELCKIITDTLHERGHEMTFVTAYPTKRPRYKEIAVDMDTFADSFPKDIRNQSLSFGRTVEILSDSHSQLIRTLFKSDGFVDLLNNRNREKYDLFIMEYYLNEALLAFSIQFNCPAIMLTSMSFSIWLAMLSGNPLAVATTPGIGSKLSQYMDYEERKENLVGVLTQYLIGHYAKEAMHKSIYKEFFPLQAARVPFDHLNSRVSSVLINSHPSFGLVRPLLPNAIEIGGYHVMEPKPLPKDIQAIMNESEDGVILFSLGSSHETKEMEAEIITSILKVFATLKHTILWKFDGDMKNYTKTLPRNIILRNWLPQTGILSHPNLKLFISPAGILSCYEAIHYAKPMLAIPIGADEYQHARRIVEKGFGIMLEYGNITKKSFKWAMNEVLNQKQYAIKAKEVSMVYHDRPMKPRDLMVYHIEYVVRTHGAPHLTPPRLPYPAILLLDVLIGLIIPPMLVIFVISFVCYRFWRV